jgi:outer membrane protein TolC
MATAWKVVIGVACACTCGVARAEVVKLGELEARVTSSNRPEAAISAARVRQADAEIGAAQAAYYPTFTANIDGTVAPGRALIPYKANGRDYWISGTQTLAEASAFRPQPRYGASLGARGLVYDFGRTASAVDAAHAKARASQADADARAQALVMEVRVAYLRWSMAYELWQVARQAEANAKARVDRVAGLIAEGAAPPSAATAASAQANAAATESERAELELETAKLELGFVSAKDFGPEAEPDPDFLKVTAQPALPAGGPASGLRTPGGAFAAKSLPLRAPGANAASPAAPIAPALPSPPVVANGPAVVAEHADASADRTTAMDPRQTSSPATASAPPIPTNTIATTEPLPPSAANAPVALYATPLSPHVTGSPLAAALAEPAAGSSAALAQPSAAGAQTAQPAQTGGLPPSPSGGTPAGALAPSPASSAAQSTATAPGIAGATPPASASLPPSAAATGTGANPQIEALERARAAAEAARRMQARMSLPSIGYRLNAGLEGQDDKLFPIYGVGLGVTIPLWDGGATSAAEAGARAAEAELAAQLELERARDKHMQERRGLQIAHADRLLALAETAVALAETRVQQLMEGPTLATAEQEALAAAQADRTRANAELVRARAARVQLNLGL